MQFEIIPISEEIPNTKLKMTLKHGIYFNKNLIADDTESKKVIIEKMEKAFCELYPFAYIKMLYTPIPFSLCNMEPHIRTHPNITPEIFISYKYLFEPSDMDRSINRLWVLNEAIKQFQEKIRP